MRCNGEHETREEEKKEEEKKEEEEQGRRKEGGRRPNVSKKASWGQNCLMQAPGCTMTGSAGARPARGKSRAGEGLARHVRPSPPERAKISRIEVGQRNLDRLFDSSAIV